MKTEKILTEYDEKFKILAEQSPNMIFINKMGRIIYANQICETIMGYKIEELLSPDFNFLNLIAPESIELIKESFNKHKKGEDVQPFEYKIISKQGKLIDSIITTKLINYDGANAILGIVTDISARKLVEKALKESENKYRTLFENAGDAIFIMEGEGSDIGKILSANNAAAEMHGCTKEELLTKKIVDLDAQKSTNDFSRRANKVLSGEWIKEEIFHQKKDGTIFPVEICAGILELNNHKYFFAFDRDVTLRYKMEESLKKAKNELELQNEKLKKLDKMKDNLIRDVSHELKTPVAKHKMQIDLLIKILDKHGIKKECSDILKGIEATFIRQESVINNILNLSRLKANKMKYNVQPTRLDQVIDEVLNDYQLMLTTHDFIIEKKMSEVIINSDKKMIFHVFSNLINNAIKYRNQSVKPYIGISFENIENVVRIKIKDNGIGLSEKDAALVFDHFYQACTSSEGIGVGLTIVQIIVNDLKGKVWLESEGLGKGITAVVEFPF